MAENAILLDEALALALKLSPADRLKLVEQVVSSVERDMTSDTQATSSPSSGHWGADLIARLDQLDLTEWEQMDMPDVGEWVHNLRHQESERHQSDWNDEPQ